MFLYLSAKIIVLLLISPAKTLDFETPALWKDHSESRLLEKSEALMDELKLLKSVDLQNLMGVSEKIADLNLERNKNWKLPIDSKDGRVALQAFKGDVYEGLDAQSLNPAQVKWLQKHLRILSGLYGVLRPMDLMLPYRLEMGTKFENKEGPNLYKFWKDLPSELLLEDLSSSKNKEPWIVNLASNEYFKVINKKLLLEKSGGRLVTPQFKDWKNGQYKMISFYAKRARGMMVRHLAENKASSMEDILSFSMDGYEYNHELSKDNEPVFTRNNS
jgi:cytoplasmic iron level regulating protein YaaA (DUF328/UPF0246 family)